MAEHDGATMASPDQVRVRLAASGRIGMVPLKGLFRRWPFAKQLRKQLTSERSSSFAVIVSALGSGSYTESTVMSYSSLARIRADHLESTSKHSELQESVAQGAVNASDSSRELASESTEPVATDHGNAQPSYDVGTSQNQSWVNPRTLQRTRPPLGVSAISTLEDRSLRVMSFLPGSIMPLIPSGRAIVVGARNLGYIKPNEASRIIKRTLTRHCAELAFGGIQVIVGFRQDMKSKTRIQDSNLELGDCLFLLGYDTSNAARTACTKVQSLPCFDLGIVYDIKSVVLTQFLPEMWEILPSRPETLRKAPMAFVVPRTDIIYDDLKSGVLSVEEYLLKNRDRLRPQRDDRPRDRDVDLTRLAEFYLGPAFNLADSAAPDPASPPTYFSLPQRPKRAPSSPPPASLPALKKQIFSGEEGKERKEREGKEGQDEADGGVALGGLEM